MQPLDLYASIEEYLEFDEEIEKLYKAIGHLVLSKEPKTLLDIGCGQGDFCHLMQYNGIKTLGVDLSAKQIEIAQSKGINAECMDIKDIEEKYECATAVFDVVNYLPNNYIKEFISYTYNLLEDGGCFIFDLNSHFGFNEVAQGTLTIDKEDKFIAIDANFLENVLYTDITLFTKDGELFKRHSGTIEQFYYDNEQMINILQNAGFKVEKIVDFNLHNYDEDDKYIFVCKKEVI